MSPEPNTGCWLWLGCIGKHGYGRFNARRTPTNAYAAGYRLYRGAIPKLIDGHRVHLDHLRRQKACVNPAHLEVVTARENAMRGVGPSARRAVATHCENGHAFDAENTAWWGPKKQWRACRRCHAEREAARYRAGKKKDYRRVA